MSGFIQDDVLVPSMSTGVFHIPILSSFCSSAATVVVRNNSTLNKSNTATGLSKPTITTKRVLPVNTKETKKMMNETSLSLPLHGKRGDSVFSKILQYRPRQSKRHTSPIRKRHVQFSMKGQISSSTNNNAGSTNSTKITEQNRNQLPVEKNTTTTDQQEVERDERVGRKLFTEAEAKANLGKWDEALSLWHEAFATRRSELGPEHLNVARALVCTGISLAMLGRPYESIQDLEKGLRIQKMCLGNNHLEVAETLLCVGKIQQIRGNYVEATQSFQEAIDIQKSIHGKYHPDVAATMCTIGHAYHQRRRYKEAVKAYSKALTIYKATGLCKEHRDVAKLLRCFSDTNIFADCLNEYWGDSNGV